MELQDDNTYFMYLFYGEHDPVEFFDYIHKFSDKQTKLGYDFADPNPEIQ